MRFNGLIAVSAVVLGATVMALVQTTLVGSASAGAIAAATVLGALGGIAVVFGLPGRAEFAALGKGARVCAAVCGAAGLAAAPMLVMANRHTDAPSASEVLFFTTAAWGLIAVVASVIAGRPKDYAFQLAAAATALVATAALVASWEYPSSFSPFVKFPREELAMLLGGAGWAAFSLALVRSPEASRRAVAWVGVTAALAVSVVAALSGPGEPVSALGAVAFPLALYAAAAGVLVAGWCSVVTRWDVTRAGALLFLPPLVITAASAMAGSAAGGQPMLLGRVLAASVLAAVAVAALSVPAPPASTWPWRRSALAAAAVALALAAAGLASETVKAAVAAHASAGAAAYQATWVLAGWEAAGGWIALVAAALLLAVAFETRRPVAVGLAAVLSFPVLRAVPLHTWTTWLPARVQQDFGTEYARLTFEAMPAIVQAAAVIVAGLGLVAVGAARAAGSRRATKEER